MRPDDETTWRRLRDRTWSEGDRAPGLTWRQKLVAGAVTAAVIAGGLNGIVQAVSAGTDYGCKHGWWVQGCAPRQNPAAQNPAAMGGGR